MKLADIINDLTPYKTRLNKVYKYDNLEQLQKLYTALSYPTPINFETDWATRRIDTSNLVGWGLLCTWSKEDVFDDYLLAYCTIIDGAKI